MKRKREMLRLSKKQGWYDGKSGVERRSWPYDDVERNIAYDDGYYEGEAAAESDRAR